MPAPTTPAPVTGVFQNVTIRVKLAPTVGPSLTKEATVLIPSCTSAADAQTQALALVPGAISASNIIRYPIRVVPM